MFAKAMNSSFHVLGERAIIHSVQSLRALIFWSFIDSSISYPGGLCFALTWPISYRYCYFT
jgi:hypothetical protein